MERLMTVEEVAELLGISQHTVYSWACKRRLPLVKLGTRTMFEPGEVRRWIKDHSHRETPPPPPGSREMTEAGRMSDPAQLEQGPQPR